tara:strand:- start:337 stop:813 length:477 start_codon:yes stop_codon:yes gene_type:complete
LIKNIGISIYDPLQLDNIIPMYDFDIVQSPLNILDRRILDSGWARKLQTKGIKLHVRSIFLQGLLLMNKENRDLKFNRWSPLWSEWEDWLSRNNINALSACLNFALHSNNVDKVIIGLQNVEQFEEIISSISNKPLHIPNWSNLLDSNLINPSKWSDL